MTKPEHQPTNDNSATPKKDGRDRTIPNMTKPEHEEFSGALAEGRYSLPTVKRTQSQNQTTPDQSGAQSDLEQSEPLNPKSLSQEDSLRGEIYRWHLKTQFEHFGKQNPRHHADAAVKDLLDPPCTTGELLEFFTAYVIGYEIILDGRTTLDSAHLTDDEGEVTSIALASSFPKRTKARLKRLAEVNADDAQLFRFFEFAGCTPEEIASYVGRPIEVVKKDIDGIVDYVRNG